MTNLLKNKKVIIIGSVIVIAATVATFLLIRNKKKKEALALETANKGKATTTTPASTGIPGVVFPVKMRSGIDIPMPAEQAVIKNIQKYLNSKMTFQRSIPENGLFDAYTESMCQSILGVKSVSYSLYKEILSKLK